MCQIKKEKEKKKNPALNVYVDPFKKKRKKRRRNHQNAPKFPASTIE
jgi:hypothetical protein